MFPLTYLDSCLTNGTIKRESRIPKALNTEHPSRQMPKLLHKELKTQAPELRILDKMKYVHLITNLLLTKCFIYFCM